MCHHHHSNRSMAPSRGLCGTCTEWAVGGAKVEDCVWTCFGSCSSSEMVRAELRLRLNHGEYTDWLKAGRCLLILRHALQPFISQHVARFHAHLLQQNTALRKPCVSSCRPRGNKLSGACTLCAEWQAVIMRHHRQHDVTVHWDNCCPAAWRTEQWEVAKAYMPRGQNKVKDAQRFDASALLNLINHCDWFQAVNTKQVREVIRYRNELMHSCEMQVSKEWMRHYQRTLRHFVQQLHYVPEMAAAEKEMEEMLSADLTVCVSGSDRLDSAAVCDSDNQWETSADLISQWETELLQERLQELLWTAEDKETRRQDSEQLRSLAGFLQANRDLSEKFSAELQAISSLEDRQ